MRVQDGSDALYAIPDAIDPFMLQCKQEERGSAEGDQPVRDEGDQRWRPEPIRQSNLPTASACWSSVTFQRPARVGEAVERAGFEPALAATGEQGLLLLREWPRRIGWLYTEAELPAWLMAGSWRMSSTEPTRLGPCSMVFLHTRKYNLMGGIALTTPVSARKVAEVLLRLSQSGEMPAAEVMRRAA